MALAYLAQRPGVYRSVREIVEQLGLPRRLLAEVLKELALAELVEATRGPCGGYRLTQPARSITLSQVVEALEGPLKLAACQESGPCRWKGGCNIQEGVQALMRSIHGLLEEFNLESFLPVEKGDSPGETLETAPFSSSEMG